MKTLLAFTVLLLSSTTYAHECDKSVWLNLYKGQNIQHKSLTEVAANNSEVIYRSRVNDHGGDGEYEVTVDSQTCEIKNLSLIWTE